MHKITKFTVTILLGLMFFMLFTSAWNDSATMDELAHIPAAYSYLSQKDYRLNPEHPPLIKDLSAIPLMFLNLNFPTDIKEWTTYVNGQWDMGRIFIYESGNNADTIIRFSRLPIMLLAILFGFLFFRWTRSLYGNKVALLSLFLFTFSPTFLAHSRYVTTDLAAAFGFFIGIAAFINFLYSEDKKNHKKSLIICGIAFGIAQLLKFSLILLAPLYVIFGALWVFLKHYQGFNLKAFIKEELLMMGKIILIGIIGIVVIWPVYMFHVWNHPVEKQVAETKFLLSSFAIRPMADFAVWLSGIPVVRAIGQYILGLFMVLQRAAGGNTTYFMGQISAAGWSYYFPLLYLLKEHLAFHLLTLLAILFGIKNILKSKEKNIKAILEWMKENFALTASIIFIAIYWLQAISSPLNIGVRHVLPTFPFIYLLVARQSVRWIKGYGAEVPTGLREWVKRIHEIYIGSTKRALLLTLFIIWMIGATLITSPYFLSYYNELAGGTLYGYKVATDSNYDWGQDLKRLKNYVEKNNIEKIAIDYFGGGNPRYYFGDKFEPWWSAKGQPEGWFAVSLTFQMGGHAKPVKNFIQKPEDTYSWLKGKEPEARAGTSIFIYKF
jgi:hypothetical protein